MIRCYFENKLLAIKPNIFDTFWADVLATRNFSGHSKTKCMLEKILGEEWIKNASKTKTIISVKIMKYRYHILLLFITRALSMYFYQRNYFWIRYFHNLLIRIMLSIKNKYTISAKIINGLRPYVKIFKWHQQKDYQWLLILLWMKEEQLMKQK